MEQEKRIFDGAWVEVAPVKNGRVMRNNTIKVDISNMTSSDEFNYWLKEAIGTTTIQITASSDVPSVFLNKDSIDPIFFKANKDLPSIYKEPYKIWLKRQDEEFEYEAYATPDEFLSEYFGKFESLEEYAIYEIEHIDKCFVLPMKLSGKVNPKKVIEDKEFMSLLWIEKGKPTEDGEDVIYVFHTKDYQDIVEELY